MLYRDENEYFNYIESFLQSIPLKEQFLKRIEIVDIALTCDE